MFAVNASNKSCLKCAECNYINSLLKLLTRIYWSIDKQLTIAVNYHLGSITASLTKFKKIMISVKSVKYTRSTHLNIINIDWRERAIGEDAKPLCRVPRGSSLATRKVLIRKASPVPRRSSRRNWFFPINLISKDAYCLSEETRLDCLQQFSLSCKVMSRNKSSSPFWYLSASSRYVIICADCFTQEFITEFSRVNHKHVCTWANVMFILCLTFILLKNF